MAAKVVDYRFKILYVIGALLVIEGHFGGWGMGYLESWFPPYSFHLALFMFASGYFYNSEAEKNVSKYIVKKVKTLLVPLYLWNFFYGIVLAILHRIGFTLGERVNWYTLFIAPINDGHQFAFNMGGWFIIPLFMVQVYNILFRKIVSRWMQEEWMYFVVNLCFGMIGIYIAAIGLHTGWWLVLTRMLYFLPFYNLGIIYRSKIEKWDKKIPNAWYFAIVFVIQGLIILLNGKAPSYLPSWCSNFDNNIIQPFIAGAIGIAFWFRIASYLEPVLKKSRIINTIADNAYSIMINQFLGAFIIKSIYAVFAKFTPLCSGFEMDLYKSTIWYLYCPPNFPQMRILYVIMGFMVSILLQKLIDWIIRYKCKLLR